MYVITGLIHKTNSSWGRNGKPLSQTYAVTDDLGKCRTFLTNYVNLSKHESRYEKERIIAKELEEFGIVVLPKDDFGLLERAIGVLIEDVYDEPDEIIIEKVKLNANVY